MRSTSPVAGFEDEGMGPGGRECGWPLEAGKGKCENTARDLLSSAALSPDILLNSFRLC